MNYSGGIPTVSSGMNYSGGILAEFQQLNSSEVNYSRGILAEFQQFPVK